MKTVALLSLALTAVDAFPFVFNDFAARQASQFEKRDYAQPGCKISSACDKPVLISNAKAHIPSTDTPAIKISKARDNCGFLHSGMCKTFSTAQYVSNTGLYKYIKPGPSDIRGPCPGLNAAANHNYLPRSGLATIAQTIDGLGKMYGMSVDLAGFLAAYAIAFDGDVVSGQWSIGGPNPNALVVPGLLGQPTGISYSHNNYEGDTSIGRCDSYINGGDAHSLSMTRFAFAYASGQGNPRGNPKNMRYTLDDFSRLHAKNTHRSIQTNPYYFAPLFSTTLVAPAAYNFVINFMSNRSATSPAGYLDGAMFKQFFGVTGDYPNFKWLPGQERMPDNWYRRPFGQEYNAVDVFGDLAPEFAAYPDTFRFGGNVNGVNTYTGIDINNLTGGVYNAPTLFQGNNFACFFLQTEQQAIPLALQNGLDTAAQAIELITQYLGPIASKLSCKPIGKYDSSVFTKYTGYSYAPTANPAGPVNC